MKRLDNKADNKLQQTDNKRPKEQKEKSKGPKNFLEIVADRQEAIDKKIERIEGRILGMRVNKLDIGSVQDVWVPYCVLKYDYEIPGGKGLKRAAHRKGKVYIIYDLNEEHAFQYDQIESGELPIVRASVPVKEGDRVIKIKKSDKELDEEVRDYIQMKIMLKTYGHAANLTLKEKTVFYRPAVELEVMFKGRNRNLRYAYLDEYAVTNEHILGMKYRLKNS